jgi:hypothetical protein
MMGYSIPEGHWRLLIGIGITTAAWLLVTFLTQPEKDSVLRRFYELVGPASLGWKPVLDRNPDMKEEKGQLPFEILLMLIGCATVYAALFATGYWMYGNQSAAIVASALAIAGTLFLLMSTKKLRFQ